MASSLGTLTLDLIARIGGFTSPLEKAERAAAKAGKGIGDAADSATAGLFGLSTAAEFVSGAIGAISVGAIFTSFINNTIDAENEQQQLAAVLKSTAQAAGFSAKELNGMSDAMKDATTFSGGEVTRAQTALLAFTGIAGKEFPRAMQAAADMAARTGTTIQQSAETIGRALDVPSAGLSALSKQGFRFTEDQKKLVDALESVGDTAAAQGIVLQGLEATYGGAAAAARDSLGGALQVLTNSFNDFLTKSGGLDVAKNALMGISKVLNEAGAADGLVAAAKAAAALATVLTARLIGSVVSTAASFVAMQAGTLQVQLALARMSGVSTGAALALVGLGAAARAASAALALVGGPVGLAVLAASAVVYFASSSSTASAQVKDLAQKVDYLNQSFDGLTKNQATYTLKGLSAEFKLQQYAVQAAQIQVKNYKDNLAAFPNDSRVKEWTAGLVEQSAAVDTATQKLDALGVQMKVLNGIMAAPVTISASKVYTELAAKIDEQILVADKKTEAEKLQARISAGLVKGLKDGEGDLLVSKQKTLDTIEKTVAANKKAEEDGKAAAKNAAAAALATLQRGEDAITAYKRQIELIDESTGARAKASEVSKAAFDTEQGKLKDISVEQKSRLVDLAKELDAKKALQKANEELVRLAAYESTLRDENQTVSDSFNLEFEGAGTGDKLKERRKADLAIEQDYDKKRKALYDEFKKASLAGDPEAEERLAKETALLEDALNTRRGLQEEYYANQDELQKNWLAGVGDAWANYRDIATDYNQQAADATSGLLGDTTSSISDSLQGLALRTMTLGEAFVNLGTTMASSVLKSLTDIAAQWIVTQTIQALGIDLLATKTVAAEGIKTAAKVTGDSVATASSLTATATTTAAQVTAAGTTLSAWLPAALVASVGSFGAAAIVGGAALVAAFALLSGFEEGGYTGDGASSAVAGVVHKGEYVFTKAETQAIGKDRLAQLAANGFEDGGYVTLPGLKSEGVTNVDSAARISRNVYDNSNAGADRGYTVNLIEDASKAGKTQMRDEDDERILDIFISDLYSDGKTKDAMSNKFGLKGVGS